MYSRLLFSLVLSTCVCSSLVFGFDHDSQGRAVASSIFTPTTAGNGRYRLNAVPGTQAHFVNQLLGTSRTQSEIFSWLSALDWNSFRDLKSAAATLPNPNPGSVDAAEWSRQLYNLGVYLSRFESDCVNESPRWMGMIQHAPLSIPEADRRARLIVLAREISYLEFIQTNGNRPSRWTPETVQSRLVQLTAEHTALKTQLKAVLDFSDGDQYAYYDFSVKDLVGLRQKKVKQIKGIYTDAFDWADGYHVRYKSFLLCQ